jgi:probable HAF family extracellular repeat protein
LHAVTALSLLLAGASPDLADAAPSYPRYRLIDLGTLGGPNALPIFPGVTLNDRGEVIAQASTAMPDPNNFEGDGLVWHGILSDASGIVRDLGALPGPNRSLAGMINQNGLIVGFSTNGVLDPLTDFPETRAVLWDKSLKIVDLGTLGGNASTGNDVNSRGQVVGVALNAVPENPDVAIFFSGGLPAAQQARAFLWQNGSMRDLGTLGGNDASAIRMNESGQVVGFSSTGTEINDTTGLPTTHPFLWKNGTMTDLGTLGGTLATIGSFNDGPWGAVLNEHGEVAGTSMLPGDETFHAFIWSNGRMTDLGTLGGSISEAYAINGAGQVVGRARLMDTPLVRHAFLWEKGTMIDLGTVDPCTRGTATSINSKGQIVGGLGACTNNPDEVTWFKAFYFEKGKPMVDLNTLVEPPSSLYMDEAMFINERGEILAGAYTPTGESRAVLLVPLPGR